MSSGNHPGFLNAVVKPSKWDHLDLTRKWELIAV